jgi:flagellar transcriptional activator FlhD
MLSSDYLSEIRDVNLSYLMIAVQLIRHDRAEAIFRLGISGEIADVIAGMSNGQILKLASCNMMLSRFRFDDSAILSTLLSNKNERNANPSHASIVMSAQAVEAIV